MDVVVPQTVMLDVPLMPADVPVTVVFPAATPETVPPVLTVATATLDETQPTVTGPVLPSLKVPVAVNCTVHTEPAGGGQAAIEAVDGVTAIAVSAGLIKNPLQPASSNANIARATHSRFDRPRVTIPASEKGFLPNLHLT